jgi:hypothetical protein
MPLLNYAPPETIVSLPELPPPMKRQKLGKGCKDPLEMKAAKAHHIIQQARDIHARFLKVDG